MSVYFDNAATTPLDPNVISEMEKYLREMYGNPSSIHSEGRKTKAGIEKARKTIASALNSSIGEIFFTSGGTEANNMAIKCAVRDLDIRRIISSPTEHHCVLHTLQHLVQTDELNVQWVKVDPTGQIDTDHLRHLLSESNEPTLVSLMHANNEIGAMIDIYRIGNICKEFGAYFHSDTVQTVGHFEFDLQNLPIHFMSGAAHKFHGPKGVGFIYINSDIHIDPLIDGGAQERNMRAGTENVYGIAGMSRALELAYDDFSAKKAHVESIRDQLKTGLQQTFADVTFNGPQNGESLYTILNVGFPKTPKSDMLLYSLDIRGICASAGSACSSGATSSSHVIEALKLPEDRSYIRFSFSHLNTEKEVDYLLEKLKESL